MVQLTPEQVEAVRLSGGDPVTVEDPESHQRFYIVTEEARRILQEIDEEDRVLAAFQRASVEAVKQRLQEDQ